MMRKASMYDFYVLIERLRFHVIRYFVCTHFMIWLPLVAVDMEYPGIYSNPTFTVYLPAGTQKRSLWHLQK